MRGKKGYEGRRKERKMEGKLRTVRGKREYEGRRKYMRVGKSSKGKGR